MKLPLQITFKNIRRSDALAELIQGHAEKLDELFDRIISCRVVVTIPHKHHRKGNFVHIRIDMKVPGEEIVVNREPSEHAKFEDLNAVLTEVFERAERRLEEYVQRQRGMVKMHQDFRQAG